MFEIDVQLRDGNLVCSHYLPLPGGLRFAPVERDNWRFRGIGVKDPSLDAVLALIPAGCGVLLDPKHHAGMSAEDLQIALTRRVRADDRPDRYLVSTGNPRLLGAYEEAGVRTWRSIGDRADLGRVLSGRRLAQEGVSIRHSLLDAETIFSLRAVTSTIVAWTVNSPRRAIRLAQLGVAGITTDRFDVLSIVRDRGE